MTRIRRRTFAALIASLLVVSMVGAAVAPAPASAASGPEGMLALGSGQISEDVPEGASLPIRAGDLEGAIYASDHAGTLEVVLTTPERASEYLGPNASVVANDEVAIVLRDDESHEGRDIAVELDVLEQGVGFVPSVAYGTHESGEEWRSPIERDGTVGVFHVPEFSSNSVTFSGQVSLTGDAAGNGTTYNYDLGTTEGVDDFAINMTGETNAEWDNSTATINSEASIGDVSGNAEPVGPGSGDPLINITGQTTTWSDSAGYYEELTSMTTTVEFGAVSSWSIKIRDGGSSDQTYDVDLRLVDTTSSTTIATGTVTKNDYENTDSRTFQNVTSLSSESTLRIEVVNPGSYPDPVYLDDGQSVTSQAPDDVIVSTATTSQSLGSVSDGETVSTRLDVQAGETVSVAHSGDGSVDATLWVRERTQTQDPGVMLNGETIRHDGMLADGETVSLPANKSHLVNGTNNVTVTTNGPDAGPESLVGFEYRHDASGTTKSVDVEATSWTEAFNISHTFPSQTADAESVINFSDRVVEIDSVEYRQNGGEWNETTDYQLDGNDLTINLGDVEADTDIGVRATGYKVGVTNGSIDVLDATVEGDQLDTKIEIVDRGEDFAIDVSGSDRIHYIAEETWTGESGYVVAGPGGQALRLADANAGSTARVRTLPIEVVPTDGRTAVHVEDPETMRFRLDDEGLSGSSSVDVTYHDTVSGDRYVLWSVTQGREIDADRAESPVSFSTGLTSSQTFEIRQRDRADAVDGLAPQQSPMSTAPLVLVVPAVGISVAGLFWAGRRFGGATGIRGNAVLLVGSTIVAVAALELVSPGTISSIWQATVFALGDAAASGVGAVLAAFAVLLALWQINTRTSADVPWYVTVPTVAIASIMALEAIRPGSVLGVLEGVLTEVGGLVVLVGLGIIAYVIYSRRKQQQAEASTPDTQVELDLGGEN